MHYLTIWRDNRTDVADLMAALDAGGNATDAQLRAIVAAANDFAVRYHLHLRLRRLEVVGGCAASTYMYHAPWPCHTPYHAFAYMRLQH